MESYSEVISRPIIHQVLHGYSDGHTLLAASCELFSDEKRTLLLMSDLSGSGMQPEFDNYLTGYPLPGGRYYALARTWYAKEMHRPGCVWTHSLLIETALLGRLRNLYELTLIHKRPEVNNYSDYNKPIDLLDADEYRVNSGKIIFDERKEKYYDYSLGILINELYCKPNSKLVIPDVSPSRFEDPILTLWSYQWPRLRRSFSFCTGSISLRYLDDEALDFQVIPLSSERGILRRTDSYINVVRLDKPSLGMFKLDKISEVISDKTLDFMYYYGSDVIGNRSKYLPLVLSCQYLESENLKTVTYKKLIEFIFNNFPAKNEGKRLKKSLINKKMSISSEENLELLIYIIEGENYSNFIYPSVDIDKLLSQLNESGIINRYNFEDIFSHRRISESRDEITNYIVLNFPIEDWISFEWVSPETLSFVLAENRELEESITPWILEDDIQKKWFTALSGNRNTNWKNVVVSMLSAGNERWVLDVVKYSGDEFVFWVLDWANEKFHLLPSNWEAQVNVHSELYIQWLVSQEDASLYVLSFITKYYGMFDDRLYTLDESQWTKIVYLVFKLPYSIDLIESAAILAVIGILKNFLHKEELVSALFQPIHNLTEANLLPEKVWRYIELIEKRRPERLFKVDLWDSLVSIKYKTIPYWDRCEHLRQLMVDYWILYDWSEMLFLKAFKNEDTFFRAIRYCSSFKEGKKFLIKLKNVSKVYKASENYDQLVIIKSLIKK